jgi:hypothetical protein
MADDRRGREQAIAFLRQRLRQPRTRVTRQAHGWLTSTAIWTQVQDYIAVNAERAFSICRQKIDYYRGK